MKSQVKRICINCGSSPGNEPCYIEAAQSLGQMLAERNYEMVYGGADIGLMGCVADAAIKAGGKVIGVIPKTFADRVSHQGLTELRIVGSMHERKAMMFDLSDAFIALPGGFGTLDEIMELFTWAQIGYHKKPCGLLNVNGYYDLLLSFLDNAVRNGFILQEHRTMVLVSDEPEDLIIQLENYAPPENDKWVGIKTRT